jgi:hypothetical protein
MKLEDLNLLTVNTVKIKLIEKDDISFIRASNKKVSKYLNTNYENKDKKLVKFLVEELDLVPGENIITVYTLINVFQEAEIKYGVKTKFILAKKIIKKVKKGETSFKLKYVKGLKSLFKKLKYLELIDFSLEFTSKKVKVV